MTSRLKISMKLRFGPLMPLGDLDQIEMIEPARRDRHADEHAPGEEAGGDQLQPEPRPADLARHHVEEHRQREPAMRHAAQHHQHVFERVERLPFQMAVARE